MTDMLANTATRADLGCTFGPDFTEAEVRYLLNWEWQGGRPRRNWRNLRAG